MINFNWHKFSELTTEKLYAVLRLRAEVFVVEQNCVYLDPDGEDIFALHLLGIENGSLSAYLRLFPPTNNEDHIVFGRVIIEKSARAKGHGKKLMQELLNYCDENFPGTRIKCAAQHYSQRFYESLGFKVQGKIYELDGIFHITMQRDPRYGSKRPL